MSQLSLSVSHGKSQLLYESDKKARGQITPNVTKSAVKDFIID